jgi:hypothetical protein
MSTAERFPYERQLEQLLQQYRLAQRTIVSQIREALASGDAATAGRRRNMLASVLQTLDQLGVQTDAEARQIVADAYHQAAERAGEQAAGVGVSGVTDASFGQVSLEAVAALQASALDRLQTARQIVGRQVQDIFARAQRDATVQALLGAQGSPQLAARSMVRDLRRRGVSAFVDRSGRQWSLDTYAEMAVRTTTRQAVVHGALNRMAAQGINLARISSHAGSCTICAPYDGVLVSLDGQTRDHDGESVATLEAMPNGGPPFHPNCRHTILPVAVDFAAFLAQRDVVAA